MYQRILLAYDGSAEGVLALREGALLASQCCARIVLLAVVPETAASRMADGLSGGAAAQQMDGHKALLAQAIAWLEARGYRPDARLVFGEPAASIGAVAKAIDADLVVIGHRHRGFLESWLSESTCAYLSDHLGCALLVARRHLTEQAFDAAHAALPAPRAAPGLG
jgi:nucleotide-binding universal stress UspA family protein